MSHMIDHPLRQSSANELHAPCVTQLNNTRLIPGY
jgi:hypothetical protein